MAVALMTHRRDDCDTCGAPGCERIGRSLERWCVSATFCASNASAVFCVYTAGRLAAGWLLLAFRASRKTRSAGAFAHRAHISPIFVTRLEFMITGQLGEITAKRCLSSEETARRREPLISPVNLMTWAGLAVRPSTFAEASCSQFLPAIHGREDRHRQSSFA